MTLIDIKDIRLEGSNILNTSIKVLVRLNDTVSSCTVTIEAPCTDEKVTAGVMTQESPKIYYYIFNTTSDYEEGMYTFRVTATNSSGTCVKEVTKNLQRPSDLRILA